MSIAVPLAMSTSSAAVVTGNFHNQKCRRSSQFFSGKQDLAKKLPSLIDFRPLHRGHHQLFPSETSFLLLSSIVTEHLINAELAVIFLKFFTSRSQLCMPEAYACAENQ